MSCRRLAAAVSFLTMAIVPGSVSATVGPTPDQQEVAGDPYRAGDVVVVEANNSDREIVEAKGQTPFSLRLPDGAECPGDSANDQWRTQSFLVPATVDPAEIVFGVNDPEGEGNWSLYDVQTNPYVDELLPQNPGAGLPARIPSVPPLSFAVFPPGVLPDGEYTIGIACTYFRALASWWDTDIEIERDSSDQPAELAWRVVDPPASAIENSDTLGDRALFLVAAGVLVALAAAALLTVSRRRLPPTPDPKDL